MRSRRRRLGISNIILIYCIKISQTNLRRHCFMYGNGSTCTSETRMNYIHRKVVGTYGWIRGRERERERERGESRVRRGVILKFRMECIKTIANDGQVPSEIRPTSKLNAPSFQTWYFVRLKNIIGISNDIVDLMTIF